MKSFLINAIAGVVGGGVFLFFFSLQAAELPLAVGAGFGAWIGATLLLGSAKKKTYLTIKGSAPLDPETLRQRLRETREKIGRMRTASKRVPSKTARSELEAMCGIAEQICREIERDPSDFRSANKFLTYYMDSSVKVVEQYADLASHHQITAEAQKTLDKVEKALPVMTAAYKKQLGMLLENDVMDLDAEISVLEKTIHMEGLEPYK